MPEESLNLGLYQLHSFCFIHAPLHPVALCCWRTDCFSDGID